MTNFIKTLNRFNGNLCFAGDTDSGFIVFEATTGGSLVYASSTKVVTGVCLIDESTYGVAFSDSFIGTFTSGVLDEAAINTGIGNVSEVVRASNGAYYILDRVANELHKFTNPPATIVWTMALPDEGHSSNGRIVLRESDGVIIYNDGRTVWTIRDDSTEGTLLSRTYFGAGSDLKVVVSGQQNPQYVRARYKTVSGSELG